MAEAKIIVPDTMKIIAVAGRIQSGKDTVSKIGCHYLGEHNIPAEFRATSSYLKNYAETDEGKNLLAILGLSFEVYETGDNGVIVTRTGLRELGKVLQAEFGGDYLVRQLVSDAVEKHKKGLLNVFFVNGIRRSAEAETIRNSGFELWWVDSFPWNRGARAIREGQVKNMEEFRAQDGPEIPEMNEIEAKKTATITNNASLMDLHINTLARLRASGF